MPSRTARAEWIGDFRTGQGIISPGSGDFEAHVSLGSIVQDAPGTNPPEVLGASLAACFVGALAAYLTGGGYPPKRICTNAQVNTIPATSGKGFVITGIHLQTQAEVPGIDEAEFIKYAEYAKSQCPVSQALSAIEITLQADLV
jgi:osmotically inducible protein OsmC